MREGQAIERAAAEAPSDRLWQTSCEFCDEPGEHYATRADHDILRCARCALIWSNPLTVACTEPTALNDDPYWAEEVYRKNQAGQERRFGRQLRLFLQKAELGEVSQLRVLEVGSGLGYFLDVCEAAGVSAEGCDTSRRAVVHANQKGQRVRLGTLDAGYPDDAFDALFAFNLIEHLPHPKAFLADAHRVLKPGGVLALETPVQESLMHRLARVGSVLSAGRLTYYGLNPGGHIYKFSKRTFAMVAAELGFRCIYQRNISSPLGEIWGKSDLSDFDSRGLYKTVLPVTWLLATATGQGNRVFVMLQKVESDIQRARRIAEQPRVKTATG